MEFFIFIKNIPTHMQMICKTVKLKYFDPYLVITQSLLLQDIVIDKTVGNWYRHLIDMSKASEEVISARILLSDLSDVIIVLQVTRLPSIISGMCWAALALQLPTCRHHVTILLLPAYWISTIQSSPIWQRCTNTIFRFPCWKHCSKLRQFHEQAFEHGHICNRLL